MKQARESLSGKWGLAVGAVLVYMVITGVLQSIPKIGPLAGLLVGGPMALGLVIFSLALSRNMGPKFEQIFEGFKRYGISLRTYLLIVIFTLLWSLLLIVPGIIAALSYSMAMYIISENESMGAKEAIERSKKMMYGNKWKLFCLHLRFIGWGLLSILTLGVGFLWLIPYMQISTAKFYDDLKKGAVVA